MKISMNFAALGGNMNFADKVDAILEGRPEFSIKLIPELRDLYENYWEIRKEATVTCQKAHGYSDPEICQNISPLIAKFLNDRGIETDHVHGEMDQIRMHDYNESDVGGGAYIIDGSIYQTYYWDDYDALGIRFNRRIRWKLEELGVERLNEVIAIIDLKATGITAYSAHMGARGEEPTCPVCIKRAKEGKPPCSYCSENEAGLSKTEALVDSFTDAEIEHIKGRLLPHMLRIEKQDSTSYLKHDQCDAKVPCDSCSVY